MNSGYLILHPGISQPPGTGQLVSALKETGLIGQPQERGESSYLAGPKFLRLVTFLGCSPSIRLEPVNENDRDYCHIQLLGPYRRPRLMLGKNTRAPRCPHCRYEFSDREHEDLSALSCPGCGETIPLESLNWREQGGAGRYFLRISGVFPGEAVPSDELLSVLKGVCDSEWGWFYLQPPIRLEEIA
jgi:hypothetical protein